VEKGKIYLLVTAVFIGYQTGMANASRIGHNQPVVIAFDVEDDSTDCVQVA
jgi:hypothetical protein